MRDLLLLFLNLAGLFVVSMVVSYALTRIIRSARRTPVPIPGCFVKLRASGAMYRAQFVGEDGGGWVVSAPLQRDHHVPIRVGEEFIVEAPSAGGVLRVRAVVRERRIAPHELVLTLPDRVHRTERRAEPRRTQVGQVETLVDHRPAELIDISTAGARLRVRAEARKGDRLPLDFGGQEAAGWVLEAKPSQGFTEVRVRFESRISLAKLGG